MSPQHRLPVRVSVLVVAVTLVIAAHVVVVRYAVSHIAFGAAAGAGLVVLIILKHFGVVGLLGPFLRRLRRHR
jgi:membrane protein YdbS with pleckstrin-like domain